MTRTQVTPIRIGVGAVAITTAMAITGCTTNGGAKGDSTQQGDGSTKTLVVDNAFDLKTSDPARSFEATGNVVDKALYETTVTFTGSDVTKPVPQLTTYAQSADDKTLTLTLTGKHIFSSGNPVTADDIVWSYQRVQGIAGNPSFLLQDPAGKNIEIAKTGSDTVTLTSSVPNSQLPYILPNTSLGILDAKTLEKHGGSSTKSDAAESYLNGNSAGSGPYQLSSYDVNSKVVFGPNPNYTGHKPAYGRVVLQNVLGPQQKINVQSNEAQVALNLNADQVQGLDSGSTRVVKDTSPNVFYLWFSQDPAISQGVTDKPQFLTAVRTGIDYDKILAIAGSGSIQPGGMVPSQFLGAIKPDVTNTTNKSSATAALASAGYKGQTIEFSYPTGTVVNGVDVGTIAQALQSQLQAVGISLKLSGSPSSTFSDAYRAGKLQSGITYWSPDYPDPADYLVFGPGGPLAKRTGWFADSDKNVTAAMDAAVSASGAPARGTAYAAWQRLMNAHSPFVPVVQPGQYLVTASSVSSIVANPVWSVDLATIE